MVMAATIAASCGHTAFGVRYIRSTRWRHRAAHHTAPQFGATHYTSLAANRMGVAS